MRGKLLFGAASAALIALSGAAFAQESDAGGDASTRARFTVGQTTAAEIAPEGDQDWYRMRLEQGQRYAFTLVGVPDENGVALDPMLGIYDSDGNQLAFNDDDGGSLNSALTYAPSTTGDYFVAASGFADQSVGRYQLNASASEAPADDVGNDRNTRGRVTPGRDVTGTLEVEGDVDWYRMRVRTNQRYVITLTGSEDANDAVRDPFLRVLDADGAELGVNDDSDGSLNSRLDFVPQSAGDVFVEAGGYASAQTGVYTLSVTAEALPEDNIAAAANTRGRINLGQSLDGALDFPGDRDWYRIRLTEGQSYRFTMVSAGDAPLDDTLVKIYNSRGEELAMDDDGGEGFNSYLEFTAPSTGNYFVEARGFNDQATGSYTLAAHDGDIPADSSTDATLAASGDFREGVLSPAGDRDWYRVDLEEGQAFRLALNSAEGAPDALADPYVVLYGPDGAELARDDDGGEGLNSWLEFQATASGPHYIEVRGFVEDAQGRYQLTLIPGEIGDSAEGAEYLTPNGQGRASVIGQVGDVDWFVIETIEARPYRIYLDAVDPNPLDDPMLTLYNEQGEQILMDDDGGTGLNSRIEYASPTGGPIFAAVSSYAGGGAGSYFIRLTDTEVPGHIYTDETLEAQDDARMSRIDMPGDLDYYRVELEGGVRYVISVSGEGATPLADPFLAVVDAQNERVASDDDSGDGRDARLRFTPPQSGTYFLQASGLGRTTGDYRIGIMRQ